MKYLSCKYVLSLLLFISCNLSWSHASAESILMIGDSLSCGPFGKYMLEDLSKAGNKVTLYCAVSSAPTNWLNGKSPKGQECKTMTTEAPKLQLCGGAGNTPTLESLLKKHPGSRVIVGLGTNSMLTPKADGSYQKMAEMIKASGSKCDWIGPPHMNASQSKGFPKGRVATLENNLNSFYKSLSVATDSRCQLADSRSATVSGSVGNQTVDGVHRNDDAGKYWASALLANLVSPVSPAASEEISQ